MDDVKETMVTVSGQEEGPFGFHGVGPDAPVVANAKGGRQSKSLGRMDLIPAHALYDLSVILAKGCDKYGEDNWKDIEVRDHLNKALIHIHAHLAGDRSDNHLGHAVCRSMMAHQLNIEDGGMIELKVPVAKEGGKTK